MMTKEQLKNSIDCLENNQALELIEQIINQNLNLCEKTVKKHSKMEQQKAMAEFFGMHKELGIDSVEEQLRLIRQGRRRLFNDI